MTDLLADPFCDREGILQYQHAMYRKMMELEIQSIGKEMTSLNAITAKERRVLKAITTDEIFKLCNGFMLKRKTDEMIALGFDNEGQWKKALLDKDEQAKSIDSWIKMIDAILLDKFCGDTTVSKEYRNFVNLSLSKTIIYDSIEPHIPFSNGNLDDTDEMLIGIDVSSKDSTSTKSYENTNNEEDRDHVNDQFESTDEITNVNNNEETPTQTVKPKSTTDKNKEKKAIDLTTNEETKETRQNDIGNHNDVNASHPSKLHRRARISNPLHRNACSNSKVIKHPRERCVPKSVIIDENVEDARRNTVGNVRDIRTSNPFKDRNRARTSTASDQHVSDNAKETMNPRERYEQNFMSDECVNVSRMKKFVLNDENGVTSVKRVAEDSTARYVGALHQLKHRNRMFDARAQPYSFRHDGPVYHERRFHADDYRHSRSGPGRMLDERDKHVDDDVRVYRNFR